MAKKRKNSKQSPVEEIARKEAESGKRVSGEPDSNLAAVGAGGVTGAAAGAAIGGAVGGPIGAVVGGVVGGVSGAAAADKIQDEWDPKLEELYWERNFRNRPYYKSPEGYEEYLPAYRLGWEAAMRKENEYRNFDEIESQLKQEWERTRETPTDWRRIREIMRDGFDRIRNRQLQKTR